MLVSVIIPNYNHAKFLNQRIDSVLNQTYQDFEVIILDDVSTDASREVIHQYRHHPKISNIIFNEQNSGSTFKQWEKGISLAKGDWIWIAESDDWCETIFLETVINGTFKNANCVLGYCQSYCVDNEHNIKFQSFHNKLSEVVEGDKFIKEYMTSKNSIFNASMAIWKKSIFELVSKEFSTYKFCGDWLFWSEVAAHGSVFISGQLLNFFRKHDKDVSGKFYRDGDNFIEELRALNYIYQKGIIEFNGYVNGLQTKYRSFKLVERSIDPKKASEIKRLFLQDSKARKKLKANYINNKVKYVLENFLK